MRACRRATGLIAAAVVLASCSTNEESTRERKNEMTPTKQLLTRPNFDEAAAIYRDQLSSVREALKKIAPNVEWDDQPPAQDGESLCEDPFSLIEGARNFGMTTGGAGAIPDDEWGQAIAAAKKVLEPAGYKRVQITANKPGSHAVTFTGRYGATIDITGQRSTVISLISSGCFLTAEAHKAAAANH